AGAASGLATVPRFSRRARCAAPARPVPGLSIPRLSGARYHASPRCAGPVIRAVDTAYEAAILVPRLFRRLHPARLAHPAVRQAAAALPAWQRVLRPRLRAAAAASDRAFRPV